MRTPTALSLSLCLLLGSAVSLTACSDAVTHPEQQDTTASLTGYGTKPNGTGVHVGSTQPESWFGLAQTSATWFTNGFSQHADGSYWATGWYSIDLTLLPAEARIVSAELSGEILQVQGIRTAGTRLSIDLRDARGQLTTLQHADLAGLTLLLRVPDPTGLLTTPYSLRFGSAASLDSQLGDVDGYQVEVRPASVIGASWSSYCKGPDGSSQRAVFYQGSQWDPLSGARSDGANLVTLTCESGSVARCMSWGYRPWTSGRLASGADASLRDYHQACVHMKRAAYCGSSKANTIDGTKIIVNDPFSPPVNSGPTDVLEALWTDSGATCVSNRRRPEIPFLGCPLPLPTCPSSPSGGYLLSSSLPAAGSLLGLF